ncbi:MAG TPA: SRPBCC family protein, partial [Bradyrhizobium sp.]
MAKAYYSTVFAQPAPEVWKIIRDFNNYPVWVGGAGESRIEDGKSGDTVGAIRSVLYQGRHIRQRLLAQSDVERSQTYEFYGAASLPLTG